ncbi:MAG: PTS sugar transporter subunit IIB [Endomicrobium sp.]|nr:PTS sugar transporter subunit IIB [Endomicrobium sp.]
MDDSLVHGQIVQGWLRSLDVDIVFSCFDLVANDKMRQILMEWL